MFSKYSFCLGKDCYVVCLCVRLCVLLLRYLCVSVCGWVEVFVCLSACLYSWALLLFSHFFPAVALLFVCLFSGKRLEAVHG
jgi:hypothetical protein